MKSKDYLAVDLGFHETFKGENIVGIHECNGKVYIFTPEHTYSARKMRWYDHLWRWLVAWRDAK